MGLSLFSPNFYINLSYYKSEKKWDPKYYSLHRHYY